MMKPLPYTVTIPPPDDYYVVREDQLDKLGEGENDNSLEICLASGGIAIGLLPTFGGSVRDLLQLKSVGGFDLFLVALTIIFAVLAVTKFLQYRSHIRIKNNLKDRIKSGQKAKVASD